MSKLSRTVLKDIVREVMVEILLEGVNQNEDRYVSNINETKNYRKRNLKNTVGNKSSRDKKPSYLDNISFNQKKEKIEEAQRGSTMPTLPHSNNPVMTEIFKDTAATTLKEQIGAERNKQPVPKDEASRIARNSDLTQLFGQSASNWASLAFSENSRKN